MNIFLYVASVLIWGSTWYGVALQVGPVPALVSIFYRFALAALVLLAALAFMGRLKPPAWRQQPFIVAQALCLFSLNFICFYNAARFIASGLIAVIFSLASICNAVNARLIFGDPIRPRTLVAAALGVGGLILLFGRAVTVDLDAKALTGIGLAMIGTLFFSLGNMVSRRNSAAGISPATANAFGMSYGAAILIVMIVLTGTPVVAPPDKVYLGALVYLAVIGSVIGFTTYLELVRRVGSSRAAYATVLFPVVALALSTAFEGYRWTPSGGVGLALCLIGNAVVFAPRLKLGRL